MSAQTKLTPCHCINLRRAAGAVTDFYNSAMAPCGLTVNQFSMLWNLDYLGLSNTTSLAERTGLDRSTLVRSLKPLISNRFVEDTSAPGQRDRMLKVTPKGKMALEIGIPLWQKAQKEISDALEAGELDMFKSVLDKLLRM